MNRCNFLLMYLFFLLVKELLRKEVICCNLVTCCRNALLFLVKGSIHLPSVLLSEITTCTICCWEFRGVYHCWVFCSFGATLLRAPLLQTQRSPPLTSDAVCLPFPTGSTQSILQGVHKCWEAAVWTRWRPPPSKCSFPSVPRCANVCELQNS